MDNPQKPQQQPSQEEGPQQLACRFLLEALQQRGMTEHLILAIQPFESPGKQAEVFASSNCSTPALCHLLLFLFARMDDEAVGKTVNWVLSQPIIASKMVSYQAKQMAEQAEQLKAQAAANPLEPQPAPTVQDDKNKSWLN